jgi:hypothetical protein
VHLRYIAVNDLHEADASFVSEEVKCLRLDVGVVQSGPFQVLLGQLGECRVACGLSNRLDGLRAILGLLGTGYGGQPAHL